MSILYSLLCDYLTIQTFLIKVPLVLGAKSILGTEFQTVSVRRDHIIILILAHAICLRKRRKKYNAAVQNGLAPPFLHKPSPLLPVKDDWHLPRAQAHSSK